MNKETCKQCIANLGLTWENREDQAAYWKDTERFWNRGIIMCPAVYTDKEDRDAVYITEPPPPWCPYGFTERMREKLP